MKKLLFLLIPYSLFLTPICAQNIYTIAGDGNQGYSGDGSPAVSNFCEFNTPEGVFVDKAGNVYIGDEDNDVVRKISTNGIISTFAGNHLLGLGYSGDGGQATDAQLNNPVGVCGDNAGNIYIADYGNNVIRKVNIAGIISTIAGTGVRGFSGDGGPATSAQLYWPVLIFVDIHGNIFIPDLGNRRIREVNTLGTISTVAGNGAFGYSGDGGPAISAKLSEVTGVCVDSIGNIYIADSYNSRIRKVNTAGIISTIAGNGINGYSGDGGKADTSELNQPADVYLDASGNIFISDTYSDRIRKIDVSGIITTIGGNGYNPFLGGYSGDGGLAINAELAVPTGISIDAYGNVYFADQDNERVREIVYKGSPLGVNNIENNQSVSIYPNPNNGKFNIVIASEVLSAEQAGKQSNSIIQIYNVLGEKVYDETLPHSDGYRNPKEGLNEIDISDQPTGVYFINIREENINYSSKFIKM